MAQAREKVANSGLREAGSVGRIGAVIIIFIWILVLVGVIYLVIFSSR